MAGRDRFGIEIRLRGRNGSVGPGPLLPI